MRRKIVVIGTAAFVAGSVAGCGGGSGSNQVLSEAATAQTLDTAQALTQAEEPSEVGAPYQVADGALALADTSDTSEPMSLDTT